MWTTTSPKEPRPKVIHPRVTLRRNSHLQTNILMVEPQPCLSTIYRRISRQTPTTNNNPLTGPSTHSCPFASPRISNYVRTNRLSHGLIPFDFQLVTIVVQTGLHRLGRTRTEDNLVSNFTQAVSRECLGLETTGSHVCMYVRTLQNIDKQEKLLVHYKYCTTFRVGFKLKQFRI